MQGSQRSLLLVHQGSGIVLGRAGTGNGLGGRGSLWSDSGTTFLLRRAASRYGKILALLQARSSGCCGEGRRDPSQRSLL